MTHRARPTHLPRAASRLLLIAATSVIAVGLSGCTSPTSNTDTSTAAGFGHIHGIGVDPADGVTYIATHTGVWQLAPAVFDGKTSAITPKQVGPAQDTMGFTVAGPRHLLASGHPGPDQQTDLTPPNLGLMQSTNGAKSWKTISLRDQVDFHDLAAVPMPSGTLRVYGYDATSQSVMSSDDGGSEWTRGATMDLRDLTANAAEPDTVYATTSSGLQVSRDKGGRFALVPGAPVLFLIEQITGIPGSFVGIDTAGTVWTTDDGTATWQKRGRTQGAPQALAQTTRGTTSWILVADDSGIVASADYGEAWSVFVAGQQ